MIHSGLCPSGYVERDGKLPELSSNMESSLNMTKNECALKCNGDKSCMSFEHSHTNMKCNLNKMSEPSQVPYLDFIFCTKTGRSNFVVNVSLDYTYQSTGVFCLKLYVTNVFCTKMS